MEQFTPVDRSQPTPLYHQIYLQLREEIISGVRAFGSRLPTEEELSRQFGVSRITARRTLCELADNHLVERRRRVGTTVIFKSPVAPIEADMDQVLASLLTFGRGTQVELLEVGPAPALPPIDDALQVAAGAEVLRVVRVRKLEGAPIGYYISHVPLALGKGMTRRRLKSTPMLALLEEAGVHIGSAQQTISATLADAALSNILEVEIGSPILRVTRTVLDVSGTPVQHIMGQFCPDRYQIRVSFSSAESMQASMQNQPESP